MSASMRAEALTLRLRSRVLYLPGPGAICGILKHPLFKNTNAPCKNARPVGNAWMMQLIVFQRDVFAWTAEFAVFTLHEGLNIIITSYNVRK